VLRAVLLAAHMRAALPAEPRGGWDPDAAAAAAARAAGASLGPFLRALRAAGWQPEPFMLSSAERRGRWAPAGAAAAPRKA
jgi:hypothetical protein